MSTEEVEKLASSQEYVGFWARFGATIIDTYSGQAQPDT